MAPLDGPWNGSSRVAESGAGCTDRCVDQPPGTGVLQAFASGLGQGKALCGLALRQSFGAPLYAPLGAPR